MSKLLGIAIVAGLVTLAIIIGNRMSAEAMSVVIGVVFGVAASIPTSLLIVAATRGRRSEDPYRSLGPDPQPRAQQPSIYIVNPGAQPAQPPRPQLPEPYSYAMPQPMERHFTVVGDEDYDER